MRVPKGTHPIPNVILDLPLSCHAKMMYMILCRHAYRRPRRIAPAAVVIESAQHMRRFYWGQILQGLEELREAGLITCQGDGYRVPWLSRHDQEAILARLTR